MNIIKPASLIIQGLCRFSSENMSLYCLFIRSLGGFLLIEHIYYYPLNPAYMPGMTYYLGAFVNEQSFIGPRNRLGRQVYSPKNPGYHAFVLPATPTR